MHMLVYNWVHPLLGGFIGQEQCPSGRKGAENCGAKAIVECQQPLLSVDLTQHCQHWGCTTRHLIKTKLKYFFIKPSPYGPYQRVCLIWSNMLTWSLDLMTSAGKMMVQSVTPATPPDTTVLSGPMSSLLCPGAASSPLVAFYFSM